MRLPEDALLIALAHGLDGLMLGTTTDAFEIATFVDTTGVREIPSTPEAIEELLGDMEDAGLVRRLPLPALDEPRFAKFHSIALTEDGWARARELEEEEEKPASPGPAT
jgi:hypothetical protein